MRPEDNLCIGCDCPGPHRRLPPVKIVGTLLIGQHARPSHGHLIEVPSQAPGPFERVELHLSPAAGLELIEERLFGVLDWNLKESMKKLPIYKRYYATVEGGPWRV